MKKIITVLCAAVMALSLFAGCGQKANDNGTTAAGGTVATDGSTSMEKVIGALGESFMEANKGTTFTYNPPAPAPAFRPLAKAAATSAFRAVRSRMTRRPPALLRPSLRSTASPSSSIPRTRSRI